MFARVHFLLVSEGLCGCLANVFGRQGHRLLLRGCRSWSPLQSHLVAVCVCVCVCVLGQLSVLFVCEGVHLCVTAQLCLLLSLFDHKLKTRAVPDFVSVS